MIGEYFRILLGFGTMAIGVCIIVLYIYTNYVLNELIALIGIGMVFAGITFLVAVTAVWGFEKYLET